MAKSVWKESSWLSAESRTESLQSHVLYRKTKRKYVKVRRNMACQCYGRTDEEREQNARGQLLEVSFFHFLLWVFLSPVVACDRK